MTSTATALAGLIFLFAFLLIFLGELATTNCKEFTMPGENLDLFSYLFNLITSLFSPCASIPNFVLIIIFAPIGLGIIYTALTLIPFVGK